MTDKWKIKVIDYATGDVVKTIEATSERSAGRIDDGLNINLNHDRYYTRIDPPKSIMTDNETCAGTGVVNLEESE